MTKTVENYRLTIYDFPDNPYITDEIIDKSDKLFCMAEDAETGEINKRIEREHLSIEYLKAVRIADDKLRNKAVDEFAVKVKEHKLTELMERINLYDSFEFMKRGNYTHQRDGQYVLYYIVR